MEDSDAHLANFIEICDTVKFYRVSEDAIKLMLLLFSLRGKAAVWYISYAPNIFITWANLSYAF